MNTVKIINLALIEPTPELQDLIESDIAREAEGAAEPETYNAYLRQTVDVAELGMYGKRYQIRGVRVMLDDDFRLKPQFEDAVLSDAVHKAVRRERRDRAFFEVCLGNPSAYNNARGYYEYRPILVGRPLPSGGGRPFEDAVCWVRY